MDDSDEEMLLINYVARLDSQVKQAGCPCDENLYAHLSRDLNAIPFMLAKRLKLWRFKKELLREKMVAPSFRAPLCPQHPEKQQPSHRLILSRKRNIKENLRSLHLRTLQHNFTKTRRSPNSDISHTPKHRRRSCRLFTSRLQQNL
jgi:hypothetical protein